MDFASEHKLHSEVYLENVYQGDLGQAELEQVRQISWNNWFSTWLKLLLSPPQVVQDYELSLRLTNDEQMRQFNHQYRNLDRPTDVLAFAAAEAPIILPDSLAEPIYLGDIVISLDTTKRQAREQNHSIALELAWLASHGLLHLLGWDHPDDYALEQMLAKQSELIKLLNLLPFN